MAGATALIWSVLYKAGTTYATRRLAQLLTDNTAYAAEAPGRGPSRTRACLLTVPHTADFAGFTRDPQTSGVPPGPSGVPTVVAATVSPNLRRRSRRRPRCRSDAGMVRQTHVDPPRFQTVPSEPPFTTVEEVRPPFLGAGLRRHHARRTAGPPCWFTTSRRRGRRATVGVVS